MRLTGHGVSKGFAVGPALLFAQEIANIDGLIRPENERPAELLQYKKSCEVAKQELLALCNQFEGEHAQQGKIFLAHLEILEDVVMCEEIEAHIQKDGYGAAFAVQTVFEKYAEMLASLDDALLKERCADIQDVKGRLLTICTGKERTNLSALERPVILCAKDLLPSDTATLDRTMVMAIVTEIGGATCHSAILAKSYGIPAVLGVPVLMDQLKDGETIIVNGAEGMVITEPTQEEMLHYQAKREAYLKEQEETLQCRALQPFTQDGQRIHIGLNIGSANEDELQCAAFTDGVGLFRTEFLYMERPQPPTETEQFNVYKKVLEAFDGKEVILRTLDIGGDKQVDCLNLPVESNPFLGLRALRLCFAQKDLMKVQLRAAFRASAYGKLSIMFPMVASMEDIRQAKTVVEEVKQELTEEKLAFSPDVKIGIMVEIPSIAMVADLAAKEVDFASIGTNDLCQYLMAVDRLNPSVAEYYQAYHPAMFRMMGLVATAFAKEGKPVSVCGELGGEPMAVPLLIGLGITKLSMGMASIGEVKKTVTNLQTEQCQKLAKHVQNLPTAQEVERYLDTTCKGEI